MNCAEIIKKYLDENGYDGIACDGCGCAKDEIALCGCESILQCSPAKKILCDLCDEKKECEYEHISDGCFRVCPDDNKRKGE